MGGAAALARAVGSCQYRPGRAQPGAQCRWIFAPRVERRVAAEAKTWAEHLVTTGTFEHDTPIFQPTAANPGGKGENIAQGAAGFHSEEQLMQGWVNESEDWNGAPVTDENLYPIGHYVQMISPASKAVGCATASGGGTVDFVCRYDRSLFPQEPYIPSFMSQPAGR